MKYGSKKGTYYLASMAYYKLQVDDYMIEGHYQEEYDHYAVVYQNEKDTGQFVFSEREYAYLLQLIITMIIALMLFMGIGGFYNKYVAKVGMYHKPKVIKFFFGVMDTVTDVLWLLEVKLAWVFISGWMIMFLGIGQCAILVNCHLSSQFPKFFVPTPHYLAIMVAGGNTDVILDLWSSGYLGDVF
eukprot:UN32230